MDDTTTTSPSSSTWRHGLGVDVPADPLAAYAMGLMVRLAKDVAGQCEVAACEPTITLTMSHILETLATDAVHRECLVRCIEDAADWDDMVIKLWELDASLDHPCGPCSQDVSAMECKADAATNGVDPSKLEAEAPHPDVSIPDALSCAICCEELMLKPVTLACGHSFCQHCLELWLRNCQSCPSCRQQVDRSPQQLAVNRALQDVMTTFYPAQVREMEARDSADRLQRLRELIVKSIESGKAIRELIATEQAAIDGVAPGATVAMVLDNDVNLHERLLAIETRERLRKDKLLREASRKRHMLAYCSIVPSAPSPPTAASSSQTRTSVVTSKLASIRKFSPGTSSTRGKRGHFANVLGRKK